MSTFRTIQLQLGKKSEKDVVCLIVWTKDSSRQPSQKRTFFSIVFAKNKKIHSVIFPDLNIPAGDTGPDSCLPALHDAQISQGRKTKETNHQGRGGGQNTCACAIIMTTKQSSSVQTFFRRALLL